MTGRSLLWLAVAALTVAWTPVKAQEQAQPQAEASPPPPTQNPARMSAPAVAAPVPDRNPGAPPVETAERLLPWERDRLQKERRRPEDDPVPAPAADEAPAVDQELASPETSTAVPLPERAPATAESPAETIPSVAIPGDTGPSEASSDGAITDAAETEAGDESEPGSEAVVTAPDDAPLPDRKPLPGDRPTVAWKNPKVQAARERCTKVLEGLAIDYERLQPIRRGACGAPAPILVKSIGADPAVAIEPPATIQCPLAAALHTWFEDQVQPAARAAFDSPVVKIRNISSYKCRNRYNAANTRISEHAFANALDISAFTMANGERVTVLRGWPRLVRQAPPPPPDRKPDLGATPAVTPIKAEVVVPAGPRDASSFLRAIHTDACKTFNTVLGPKANAAHKNHFHLDMKVRRYVTICE